MFLENIKVSVLILTFNHEKYISQAIESVISQNTDFNFEIIIGDDASTDSTSDIASGYARRYPNKIKYIRQSKNLGTTRNGYECIQLARGKYIACCEGDDYWCDTNKIQQQADFLDSFPQYSAVTHEIIAVNDFGQPLKRQKLSWISKKHKFSIKNFKGIFLPGHADSMMRRNFFLNSEFDGDIFYKAHRYIGDRTVALVWASHGPIYRMPYVMSCYRIRNTDNTTFSLYRNNINSVEDDFNYTKALEIYAKEKLNNTDINFDFHKLELLVSAFAQQIKYKNFNKSQILILEIIKSFQSKVYCLFMLPYIFLRKIIIKLFYIG